MLVIDVSVFSSHAVQLKKCGGGGRLGLTEAEDLGRIDGSEPLIP
jgi:hypothetical protein